MRRKELTVEFKRAAVALMVPAQPARSLGDGSRFLIAVNY
jgi:hypothetical protein